MNNEEKILAMLTGLTEEVGKLSSGQVEMRAEMETRFSKLESMQAKQGEQLTRLEGQVTKLEGQVTKLEGQVTGLEDQVTGLKGQVTKLEGQVTGLEDQVTGLKGQVTKLESQVTRLEERVEELDARSLKSAVLLETDIPHQLGLLFEGHKTILETLAPKERVEKLEEEVTIHRSALQALAKRQSALEKAQ